MDYIGQELEIFKNATNWKNYYASKIKPYIKGDVLEVGAGIGINTQFLITQAIKSWDYVEPDTALCSQIKSNGIDPAIPQNIVNGTIESLPSNKKYDTIIYIDVLEHIEQSREEIVKVKNKLKPGGHLIILVPAFNFLYNEFDKNIGHFRRYDKTILKADINGILAQKELFYLDSLGFFASVANKWFLHKTLPTHQNINFWDKVIIPLSKITDVIFCKSFGKSLIGIYRN
jgi:SAM-dependent methyltransferase